MLDETLSCDICDWEYNTTDIFCSGCGKDINNLQVIYPIDRDIFIYETNDEIEFYLLNKSNKPLTIFSISKDINPQTEETFFIKLPYGKNIVGKKDIFKLNNSFDYPLEYILECLKDPEITIKISGNNSIQGIFFINEKSKEVDVDIIFSSPVILKKISIQGKKKETIFKYINNINFKYDLNQINTDSFDLEFKIDILNFKEIIQTIKIEKLIEDQLIFEEVEPNYFNKKAIRIGTNEKEIRFNFKKNTPDLEILSENIFFEAEGNFITCSEVINTTIDKITLKCLIDPKKIPNNKIGILTSRVGIKYKNIKTQQELKKEIKFDIQVKNEKYLDYPLVIDFGTANTSVAWLEIDKNSNTRTQTTKILTFLEKPDDENSKKHETQPTLLFFTSDKNIETSLYHFGRALGGSAGFASSVFGWKKFFGSNYTKTIFSAKGEFETKTLNVTDLTKNYLKKIIDIFEKETQLKPDNFVFTYPATYDSKKHILKNAMKELGYDKSKIKMDLNESNAISYYIAINYEHFKNLEDNKKNIFVIFDFGGGTVDITFASIENLQIKSTNPKGFKMISKETKINILDSSGPEKVGGDYLDFKISKLLEPNTSFETLDDLYKTQIDNSNMHEIDKIINSIKIARELKHNNYNKTDADIKIDTDEIKKTAKEFLGESFDFLVKSFDNLKNIKAIENESKIDYVFLCGNSSKLDLVREVCLDKLKDHIKNQDNIMKINDLKLSVVKGASEYYNISNSIKLDGLKSLPITIGYEYGGKFYTFKSNADIASSRGLNYENEIELMSTYTKTFNKHSKKEIIYFSFLTADEIEDKNIINTKSIGIATEFVIPDSIINEKVSIFIKISKDFPKIKIALYLPESDSFSDYIDYNLEF